MQHGFLIFDSNAPIVNSTSGCIVRFSMTHRNMRLNRALFMVRMNGGDCCENAGETNSKSNGARRNGY
jgi:hypothetical protein